MTGLSQRRAALVARLRVPKSRAKEGSVLVEGVHAVSEALTAGVAADFAVTSPRLAASDEGRALASRMYAVDVVRVEDQELARLSDTEQSQGVLLVAAEPVASLGAIHAGGRYLVLDRVQDPGNAGTLARAAVAFGLDAIVCPDGTVDPWSAKTVRASAGMLFRLPVVRATARDAIDWIVTSGVPILAGDASGEQLRHPSASFALVVGNEGGGVSPEWMDAADRVVAVRMPGPAESLNVAMAGSILLHTLTQGSPDV